MNKNVIILGAGGHAKVIANIIEKNHDNLIGFLDDDPNKQNTIIYNDKKVIGKICDGKKYKNCVFIIGIGLNEIRKRICKQYNYDWYTAIDPSSVIGSNVKINEGTVVMPGAVINTGTIIGKHCIINTSSSIDHDNIINDFVHISPGAHLAGSVHIESETWICTGANVINNISIAKKNIIGAGAVVINNISECGKTYIGVPAVDKDLIK